MLHRNESIHHVTNSQEYLSLISSGQCVVLFTSDDWCPPCKTLNPIFENLANQYYQSVKFLQVNINKSNDIPNPNDITAIPLLLFYHNGVKQNNLTIQGLNVPLFENNLNVFITPIQHINNYQEYLSITSNNPCVVKFTAEWCGPCKRLAPYFEEAASNNFQSVKFLEIDIDKSDQITNHEDVTGIPLLLFYHNGVKQDKNTIQGLNIPLFENNLKEFIDDINLSSTTN